MKSGELLRLLKKDGWLVVRQTGSHIHLVHPVKEGKIICPYHGSHEVGKGLEKKIKKDAGIK
jgi:predicted RNA binding protein YcfA (HicA-like mRNA interferase family)